MQTGRLLKMKEKCFFPDLADPDHSWDTAVTVTWMKSRFTLVVTDRITSHWRFRPPDGIEKKLPAGRTVPDGKITSVTIFSKTGEVFRHRSFPFSSCISAMSSISPAVTFRMIPRMCFPPNSKTAASFISGISKSFLLCHVFFLILLLFTIGRNVKQHDGKNTGKPHLPAEKQSNKTAQQ